MARLCPCCHEEMRPLTEAGATPADRCDDCGITIYRKDYSKLALPCPKCGMAVIDSQMEVGPDNVPTGRMRYIHEKRMIRAAPTITKACIWGMTGFQDAIEIGRRR
jgi:predicted RNA-binding Zn-ribbon protein involved in translation (DUF1610 family)